MSAIKAVRELRSPSASGLTSPNLSPSLKSFYLADSVRDLVLPQFTEDELKSPMKAIELRTDINIDQQRQQVRRHVDDLKKKRLERDRSECTTETLRRADRVACVFACLGEARRYQNVIRAPTPRVKPTAVSKTVGGKGKSKNLPPPPPAVPAKPALIGLNLTEEATYKAVCNDVRILTSAAYGNLRRFPEGMDSVAYTMQQIRDQRIWG